MVYHFLLIIKKCILFIPITRFAASQSDVKLKVEVRGFNLEQCTNIYQKGKITLSSKVLCAGGENGRDSCRGDSGQYHCDRMCS